MPQQNLFTRPLASWRQYIGAHKLLTFFGLIFVACVSYWLYAKFSTTPVATSYILGTVERKTISSSVSGSGQVVASDQVSIYPKVSGQITAVYAKEGQRILAGQAIAQIDSTNAYQSLRNAESDLEAAQLSLQKLVRPADQLSLTQAQNSLSKSLDAQVTAARNLARDYQDGYNDTAAVYLDLPDIMSGLRDIVTGTKASNGRQSNFDYYTDTIGDWDEHINTYHDAAIRDYQDALAAYNVAFADYQKTSQSSSTSTIENVIDSTYAMVQKISSALLSANTVVNDYETVLKGRNLTPSSIADNALTNLNAYITKMNSHLSTLLSDKNSLASDKQAILDAARNVTENQQALDKLKAGADPLDIRSNQILIDQRQNAVSQARAALADYTIRAPFTGTLGNLNLHKGDNVGSGTSVAVIVSAGNVADISLNEVDVAKVAVGQKASLTFDAIDGLTIAGHVSSISPVGTVSQGVVSYNVKIAFDTEDDRIKPGMTVNAAIITAIHTDTLVVPASAVKTSNSGSTVQVVDNPPAETSGNSSTGVVLASLPRTISVVTGISSDTQVEILSGLAEGQTVITRTISAQIASQTTSAPSLFGGTGIRATGGGTRVQIEGTRSN